MTKRIILLFLLVFSAVLLISCGESTSTTEATTEATTEVQEATLPSLENQNISDIQTALDDLGIDYTIQYQTNPDLTEDTFISYGDDLQAGDLVSTNDSVIVFVATEDLYLPDLSGMEQFAIFNHLNELGFSMNNYSFEIVVSNDAPDMTFVGYESHEVGDPVSDTETFVILIADNQETLPDLSGKLETEIKDILDDLQIKYTFSEVVDDDYPEGSFAYYENNEIGDLYEEDSTVEVVLYKNTFTDTEVGLFISKYVDSETDSAIELYNPTSVDINLEDYHLVIYTNGSFEVTHRIEFEAGSVIEANGTFLISSRETDPALQRYADLRTDDLVFNGNDTIQLRYKNDTYIDTIYNLGERGYIMDNEIYVRREAVTAGNRDFSLSEWTAFVPGYYEIIGTHPLTIDDKLTLTQAEINEMIVRGFDHPEGG
ncbi:MAG: lamin tail domain-containing protein, partial [Candidatus Izemoplasmatales bacterium]